jgi:hypothetical protein
MKLIFCKSVSISLTMLIAFFVSGCGKMDVRFPIVSAQGKLTFEDGNPLPVGTRVQLNPTEGKVGLSSAMTDAEGSFTLQHVSGRPGAEIGMYTVVLQPPLEGDGTFEKMVPREYYGEGAFAVEVKEGMAPIELKVKKLAAKRR